MKIELNTSLIVVMGPLFVNEASEDAIQGRHSDTDAKENDVVIILLAVFVP